MLFNFRDCQKHFFDGLERTPMFLPSLMLHGRDGGDRELSQRPSDLSCNAFAGKQGGLD